MRYQTILMLAFALLLVNLKRSNGTNGFETDTGVGAELESVLNIPLSKPTLVHLLSNATKKIVVNISDSTTVGVTAQAQTQFQNVTISLLKYHLGQRDWIFGEAMCKLNRTVYHSCFYCSIYFITCVSVDRYLAIVHPLKSISLLTRRQSLLVCLAVWVITSAVSYSVTQMATVQTCPDNRTVCSLYVFLNSTHESLPFSLVCTVTGCLGPFCAICYCYCSCVRQLRKQPHLSRWSQKRRKLAKVMYSALLIFGVLYLPYHLIRNLAIALQAADPGVLRPPVLRAEMAFAIEMAVCSLNTCINPLFYFLTGGDFRHHFFEMFPCLSGRVKPSHRDGCLQPQHLHKPTLLLPDWGRLPPPLL
ncbi:UNVERIFIED_CONTAM: hypothetical protein FKN15_033154 [Acipenser sinensis]